MRQLAGTLRLLQSAERLNSRVTGGVSVQSAMD